MTHEDAFLQDILENPDDDTPRLVYADWLIDRGDPVGVARPPRLRDRERQLLDSHHREWGSPLVRLGCRCCEYRRGFVEGVGLPAGAFLAHGAALFRATPVRHLKLYDCSGTMAGVASSPQLARVQTLDLENNSLDDESLRALASSPHLGNVRTLLLWSNRVADRGAQALAGATHLTRLARLDLSANSVGDPGACALAGSPLLARLTVLDLQRNRVGDPGARALAASGHAQDLRWLDLGKNPIGEEAKSALRARFGDRVRVWA
jgi:uncharacterized protein (TIGR02996 family)